MNKMMIGLAVLVFVAVSLIVYMRYITTNRPDTAQQYLDAQQAKRDARADRQERMERERLIIAGKPIPMTEEEAEEANKVRLAAQKAESIKRDRLESDTQYALENIIRKSARDPDSVQFSDQKGNCGMVNAKNGYGGYGGFKRYVWDGGSILMEGVKNPSGAIVTSDEMDVIWRKYCT